MYITGHLKDKVEEYTRKTFDIPAVFVEQTVQDGTAGAVALAREYVDQPVLIIFVATIFDADLSVIKDSPDDGIIWVKEVEDYQRFGVVVTDTNGHMKKIIEKPSTPISKSANIGLYYIRNWKLLFEGIDHTLKQPANKGEYYLTDAFQYMIDKGAKIRVIDVEGWYDAGKLDTLLDTNRVMLEKGYGRTIQCPKGSEIREPVYIEDNVTLKNSVIGPNVSLGAGSVVEGSTVRNSIIGTKVQIRGSTLTNSVLGDEVIVEGMSGELTAGDHTEIRAT